MHLVQTVVVIRLDDQRDQRKQKKPKADPQQRRQIRPGMVGQRRKRLGSLLIWQSAKHVETQRLHRDERQTQTCDLVLRVLASLIPQLFELVFLAVVQDGDVLPHGVEAMEHRDEGEGADGQREQCRERGAWEDELLQRAPSVDRREPRNVLEELGPAVHIPLGGLLARLAPAQVGVERAGIDRQHHLHGHQPHRELRHVDEHLPIFRPTCDDISLHQAIEALEKQHSTENRYRLADDLPRIQLDVGVGAVHQIKHHHLEPNAA
mmetsp:Transcript_98422/g.301018  ORF Transcript_98422/g.301018 Transcript_98422/m.301018 type:complete len:264 (-) Transcript_98422:61-852(-)